MANAEPKWKIKKALIMTPVAQRTGKKIIKAEHISHFFMNHKGRAKNNVFLDEIKTFISSL